VPKKNKTNMRNHICINLLSVGRLVKKEEGEELLGRLPTWRNAETRSWWEAYILYWSWIGQDLDLKKNIIIN